MVRRAPKRKDIAKWHAPGYSTDKHHAGDFVGCANDLIEPLVNRRASILTHPGTQFQVPTPLLIPSFSSRGFRGSGKDSEVRQLLKETAQFADAVYLISAYDVAKGNIPAPAELEYKPELIVLDSGGYEMIGLMDLLPESADDVWTADKHRSVLEQWPDDLPAIFVSYDHPKHFQALDEQIKEARKLKTKFGKHLHCFLIKPENAKEGGSLKPVLSNVAVKASKLQGFDIIGVTDKGLGSSPIDRMVQIVRLRRALDEANCSAPIHVFGSLDPLSVCLYYLAGAEIFDGLTWLRYSFSKNRCLYRSCYAPLVNGLHVKDKANHGQMLSSNYFAILKLQAKLRSYAKTGNIKRLPNSKFLAKAEADLIS